MKISLDTVTVALASFTDYPVIQNMARFYVYELSRQCGHDSEDWAIPTNGLYESFDFKNYFIDPSRRAYLIKVGSEIAGFALLNKATENPSSDWNMGEFFITARFQGRGVGSCAARWLWEEHPGNWEVAVIPQNKTGLIFWEKAVNSFSKGTFRKEIIAVAYDAHCPLRALFSFRTKIYL
jgi:predicted acetyltransferase